MQRQDQLSPVETGLCPALTYPSHQGLVWTPLLGAGPRRSVVSRKPCLFQGQPSNGDQLSGSQGHKALRSGSSFLGKPFPSFSIIPSGWALGKGYLLQIGREPKSPEHPRCQLVPPPPALCSQVPTSSRSRIWAFSCLPTFASAMHLKGDNRGVLVRLRSLVPQP